MANTLLTPSIIAQAALATLYETTVMAALVHRDYEDAFANAVGDTITIRKPAVFVAQEYNRADGITVQDANEGGIPMTLNHFADVSFSVTSEDLTLKITDFGERLLTPAMEAIAQKIDRDILALRSDVVHYVGTTAGELWNDPNAMIAAGRVLTQNKVPGSERRAVVGPAIAAEWLKADILQKAADRGDTMGLQEASLGNRLFGFDPYQTNNIVTPTPGTGISTTEVGVAFHKTAFALAIRPLALPRGAVNAAIANYKGFGLRVIYGYDMDKKQDIVSIDCLYGTKTLDPNRAVLIRGPLGS
jgi:P22 coat protein - gene protein 5